MMCCYEGVGMCIQCREFQLSLLQNLLRNLPCAGAAGTGAAPDEGGLLYPPSPPSPLDCKPSRAQLASDLLLQLDAQCKTETFPGWLEEKVDLPLYEPLARYVAAPAPSPLARYVAAPSPLAPAPPGSKSDTAELLREFETVYGAVELTHLTPPQSPPRPLYAPPALAPAAPALAPAAPAAPAWSAHLEREMAFVEEVVRHTSAHLPPASPASPPASPPASASASPSSASCASSASTDDEWERPARAKPYARSHEDRRSRKKEQNKNAATRYRQKKKQEVEVLLHEESALRVRRADLDTKCADLQREIRYLKGLMRDLFKAKGLIK